MNDFESAKPIVIFLDDETAILRSLERTFRREIFEVRVTDDPEAAIHWAEGEERVRLIVSDYRMAARSGLEVLQQLARTRPSLKRFILSGFADESLIKQALADGEVDQYLLKPWNVDDLRARIVSAVTAPLTARKAG